MNSGEGDVVPIGQYRDDPGIRLGGRVIADEVMAVRARTSTVAALEVKNTSEVVDFGQPYIDVSVAPGREKKWTYRYTFYDLAR